MRTPLFISSSAHAAVLLAAIVGLPSVDPFRVEEPPPIPVEILTVDEFTQLTSKVREPEPEAVPKPQPEPEPEPKPEAKQEPKPEPAPEPEPEPEDVASLIEEIEPLPVPEPPAEIVEPEPEPVPEPPTTETLPAPEPIETLEPPVEEAARPDPEPEVEQPVVEPPRRKPKPPPRTARVEPPQKEEKKPKFDPNQISALLNKLPDQGQPEPEPRPSGVETSEPVRDLGGIAASLTISDIAFLRQQVERCWSPPVGIAGASALVVRVELSLTPNGTLASAPVVVGGSAGSGFQVAAEAAVRAVTQCQPYTLPTEKYDAWREIIFTFDPSQMLGG